MGGGKRCSGEQLETDRVEVAIWNHIQVSLLHKFITIG